MDEGGEEAAENSVSHLNEEAAPVEEAMRDIEKSGIVVDVI